MFYTTKTLANVKPVAPSVGKKAAGATGNIEMRKPVAPSVEKKAAGATGSIEMPKREEKEEQE